MAAADNRAAVVKLLKARGAKARRGHLRLGVGELFWYLDPRLDGVGSQAALLLEVGCWTPGLPPEPDGGAVDCPLLVDLPLGASKEDALAAADGLVDRIAGIGDLPTLAARLADLPGALVDAPLRELLDGA